MLNKKAIGVAFILILALAFCVCCFMVSKNTETAEKAVSTEPAKPDPTPIVVYEQKETIVEVEVEKKITTETISDGLANMGVLVTQRYYFTQKTAFSKQGDTTIYKWKFSIPLTESHYIISYDGEILAGVDFTKILVDVDDDTKTITLIIPTAKILSCSIDTESFEVYDEKSSVFNPLTVEDFNDGLKDLENKAKAKALNKGILISASENAQQIIERFIKALTGDEYEIIIK